VPLTLTVTSRGLGEGSVLFRLVDPPPGVSLPETRLPLPSGEAHARVDTELSVALDFPLTGSVPLALEGKLTPGGPTTRVPLTLALPTDPGECLQIGFPPYQKVTPGGSTLVELLRGPGLSGPVELKVENLPPGVTARPLLMPEGESAAYLEVSVALEAPPVTTALRISATTPGMRCANKLPFEVGPQNAYHCELGVASVRIAAGSARTVPLHVWRRADFTGPIWFVRESTDHRVMMKYIIPEGAMDPVAIEFSVPADMPLGCMGGTIRCQSPATDSPTSPISFGICIE
jgi:hypothetical protein